MTIHQTLDTRDASALVAAYRDWLIARDQTVKPVRVFWYAGAAVTKTLPMGRTRTGIGKTGIARRIRRRATSCRKDLPARGVARSCGVGGDRRRRERASCARVVLSTRTRIGHLQTGRGRAGHGGLDSRSDGKVVTLTSWHVVDPCVENSLVGIEQHCPPVARVVEMRRPRPGKPAMWVLAVLALSDAPVTADFDEKEEQFATSASSCTLASSYPMTLGDPSLVVPGLPVSKLGVATGTTSGMFLEYGDYLVDYQLLSGAFTLELKEQLGFALPTLPGDSGSVVVDSKTNAVLGIVTANIEGGVTIASPLYNLGWTAVANPTSPFPAFSRTSTS